MTPAIRNRSVLCSVLAVAGLLVQAALPTESASASPPRPRASGGSGLLVALERAPAVLVGEISKVGKVDLHGYSARLRVERVIEGEPAVGAVLTIAWEELAPSRQPRFGDGDRVLVALTGLPGSSLWSRRFPEPGSRSRVFAVAADGDAFLRRPTRAAVDLVEHFLRLDRSDRDSATGVAYLAELLAGAEIPMSLAAAGRLERVASLDEKLGESSAAALIRSLLRPDATERLESRVLDLIDKHRLESLRAPLEILVAAKPLSPPIVFIALGRLAGDLQPSTIELLLKQGARYRAIAARFAKGEKSRAQLSSLMLSDADPAVRARAVVRLVELEGGEATDSAVRSLSDVDPTVRIAAARALATLGADAVAPLVSVVENGSVKAAQSAVAGLEASGKEAQPALARIADSHPDPGIRLLARVALGGSLDDHHHDTPDAH